MQYTANTLCRRNAGEEKKVRTLAKSFASPPPELMMANAQSAVSLSTNEINSSSNREGADLSHAPRLPPEIGFK
jgi:hypothetical protein